MNQSVKRMMNIFLAALAACGLILILQGCGGKKAEEEKSGTAGNALTAKKAKQKVKKERPKKRQPDIILLSVDTLRADVLRAVNPEASKLPGIDAFCRNAAVFKNAISTASWTLPAHASMLTGLYPHHHAATDKRASILPGVRTLAGMLSDAGYSTVGFTDGGYVNRKYGFSRGFDIYDTWQGKKNLVPRKKLPRRGRWHRMPGSRLFDRALAFLKHRKDRKKPVFMFLHTFAVHDYFRVHPWATKELKDSKIKNEKFYRRCQKGAGKCTQAEWDRMYRLYLADLRHLDAGFAHLTSELKKLKMFRKTYLILTSDHGEGFDAVNGRIHHGGRLHRDQLNVPLIIRGPRVKERRIDQIVSLVDLMPTILKMAGLDIPAELDGRSLMPFLGRKRAKPDPVDHMAFEHFYRWSTKGVRYEASSVQQMPFMSAAVKGNYWYINDASGKKSSERLYLNAEDALQRKSIAAKSDQTSISRKIITETLKTSVKIKGRKHMDPKVVEQLKALGYID